MKCAELTVQYYQLNSIMHVSVNLSYNSAIPGLMTFKANVNVTDVEGH